MSQDPVVTLVVPASAPFQELNPDPESGPNASGLPAATGVTPTAQVKDRVVRDPSDQTGRPLQPKAELKTENSSMTETAAPDSEDQAKAAVVVPSVQHVPEEDATKEKQVAFKGAAAGEDKEAEPSKPKMEQDESSPNKDKTPKRKPTIPKARKVNFEGFKNRFSEGEDIYALDVLVAGDDLADEIHREMQTRQNFGYQNPVHSEEKNNSGRKQTKKSSSVFDQANRAAIPKAVIQPKEGGWVRRVRIQSQPIIHHLSKVVGETWDTDTPRTFDRPFSVFIYFQDKMRDVLAELESRWAEEERRQALGGESKAVEDREANTLDNKESMGARAASIEALRDVRCYVKFVDDEIAPLARQFEGTAHKKIRFDDLWFLFKVGDLVCTPGGMVPAISGSKSSLMYQPLWRIYSLNRPLDPAVEPTLDPPRRSTLDQRLADIRLQRRGRPQSFMSDYDDDDGDENEVREGQFRVWAYYIDHNGASYGSVRHCMTILRYQGEETITSLPCYPLRYLDDWESHLEELKERGRKFESCMKNNHWSYNGWTLISRPDGAPMPANPASVSQHLQSEYIDSHVVVDFAEAFHQVPGWKPAFHQPMASQAPWLAKADEVRTVTWSDQERSKLVSTAEDICQGRDGVANLQRNDGLKRDKFLQASKKLPLNRGGHTPILLQDEDYALLSRRMFVYVLKDRKFVSVDIQYLNEIPTQDNVFKNLMIEKEYKQMVKGLVASHLAKKELERNHPGAARAIQSQDIIYGKGRGLVILLHGVPGVGKTATAEAVALEYQKPLFSITCGDLGLTPKEVEKSLTEIFRLAHLWHCVLLFDEADVFLAQRSRFDLGRNALVSVFLRILEYYNGILFLTTNRVGSLDEAFKSRIHMSLYYPPLNKTQVELIFKFARQHCAKTERQCGRWNGRQIRNAFQIASSLARYHALEEYELELAEGKDGGRKQPVLDEAQFRKVERATEAFKDYLERTKGYNDSDLAHILGDRDDLYRQERLFGTAASAGAAAATGYPGPPVPCPNVNVEFPQPMTYGYGDGTNVYQTPAHPRAGLSPGPFQTPPMSVAQGRPGLDPFTTDASMSQQSYGHDMNSGQGYGRAGRPSAYDYGGHMPPPPHQDTTPGESRYV
ncbi:hypothetical protein H634G_08407 [Metarhizium anisopliae BRIP 53293]|uniref:AAA+ ATPase domain-containing protein n=1 Tax=Metarhizium anisopliae BRIP 53293 TaxID=1291518 RepID=A0A0D9NQE2_METAN|nr:hypothetical protein H634G_08407 [Metarhizium anisopliae BRIP 53293]